VTAEITAEDMDAITRDLAEHDVPWSLARGKRDDMDETGADQRPVINTAANGLAQLDISSTVKVLPVRKSGPTSHLG
jgi:hypothetical protein